MKEILILIFFIPIMGLAQKLNVKVDALKGDSTLTTSPEALAGNVYHSNKTGISFATSKQTDNIILAFICKTKGTQIFSLKKGDSLEVRFSDKSIRSFAYSSSTMSDYKPGDYFTFFNAATILDSDDSNYFISKPIEFIRFHHTRGYTDFEIESKNSNKIKIALDLYPSHQ